MAGRRRTGWYDELPADGIRIRDVNQVAEKVMSSKTPLVCSFCGKDHTEVNRLIAGPSVYICDACIALCQICLDWPGAQGKLLIEKWALQAIVWKFLSDSG